MRDILIMRSILVSIFIIFVYANPFAQNRTYENIVPNAGFEKFSGTPIGWFYKGSHFSSVMKYWNSPTSASPDIFGERVRVPRHWSEKGFGRMSPHAGLHMVGITTYGCDEGKPHCREYLQIQLSEPLVPYQNYHVEFWVNHLPRSLCSNNLAIHFSEKSFEFKTEKLLNLMPHVQAENVVMDRSGTWQKISSDFIPKNEAGYLIIGNFKTDKETNTQTCAQSDLNFAYYYIDDIVVRKKEPIKEVPRKKDDLTYLKVKEGLIIPLKNIFFDLDKAELLPVSYKELYKLLKLMRTNPSMVIEVRGHTDNQGQPDYNQHLSIERARAVVNYLREGGITEERTQFKGFGASQPIADNNTVDGRQLNRRVEFLILKN